EPLFPCATRTVEVIVRPAFYPGRMTGGMSGGGMTGRVGRSAALAWLAAIPVWGQTPFSHQGFDALHPPDSAIPNEQVDPASGTLSVSATDLVLPGNAGFNLAITRVYNSSVYPNYDSGSTAYEENWWARIGREM